MKHYLLIFIAFLVVGLLGGYLYFNRANVLNFLTGVKVKDMQFTRLSDSSVKISFKTSEDAKTKLEYGTTDMYGVETNEEESLSKDHSVVLSGLLAGKEHNFRIHMQLSSGKTQTSQNFVIRAQ